MMRNIPQEQANKILDIAVERVASAETDEMRKLIMRLVMIKIVGEMLDNAKIVGPKTVVECYRAASDAMQLLTDEIEKFNRESNG